MKEQRYIRQTILDEIGEEGQSKLSQAHVVIVGCGGLGSIAAPYLAGSGVGKISLVDGDVPHISNLHRQIIFTEKETQKSKAEVLSDHISSLNTDINISVYSEMLTKANVDRILVSADLVLECTDTILTKYLVNDYCTIAKIPMIYGAIYKYDGYVSVFANKDETSIHLRDVFPEPDVTIPNCSEIGVLGPLAGLIGILQANEAIKWITGAGESLVGSLLTYNILENEQMKLRLKKSFHKDMKTVFTDNLYELKSTNFDYKISREQVLAERNKYTVISVLEAEEEDQFDSETLHLPLSQFNVFTWDHEDEEKYVFYCKTGKRSSSLVQQLKKEYEEGQFYYLDQS